MKEKDNEKLIIKFLTELKYSTAVLLQCNVYVDDSSRDQKEQQQFIKLQQ